MKKKIFVSVFTVLSIMLAVTACGGSGAKSGGASTTPKPAENAKTSTAPAGKKVAITIRTVFAGDAEKARRDWLEGLIKKFEQENPKFEVKSDYVDTEAHRNKLKVEMAGANPPDLFYTWGLDYSGPYARSGMLLDLTDELNKDPKWRDSILPIALDAFKYNGRNMGTAINGAVEGIYYNKELFAKYGLNPPTTYDDFLKAVETAKKNKLIPIAVGLKERYTSDWAVTTFFDRMASTKVYEELMKGNGSWVNPDYVQTIKLIQNLAASDAFPAGALGFGNAEARTMFGSGKALMRLSGSWDVKAYYSKEFPEGTGDKIGFVDIPALPGGKGDPKLLRGSYSNGMAISGKVTGDVKDGAIKLFKMITSAESLVKHAAISYSLPAVKSDDSAMQSSTNLFKEVLKATNNASGIYVTYNDLMPPGMAEVYYGVLADAMSKEYKGTPEDLLKKMDQAFKDFKK